MGQRSLFDIENQLWGISKPGDPPEQLTAAILREIFRPLPEPVHEKECKSNAGRKLFDVVSMFKILVLQTFYNLILKHTKADFVVADGHKWMLGPNQ